MENITRARSRGAAKPGRDRRETQIGMGPLLRRVLLGAALGALLFCALLLPAAAVCLRLDLKRELLPLVAIPLAGIAAAFAGYCSVRSTRKQGLPTGMLAAGALYVAVLLAAWLAVRGPLGLSAVALLLTMLLGGALGGIAAANKSVKAGKKW